MKKLVSILLAMSLVFGMVTPAAFADSNKKKLKGIKTEISEMKKDLSPYYKKHISKLEAAVEKLQKGKKTRNKRVLRSMNSKHALRFNTETIYDLDTIPARIELITEIIKAIAFDASTLRNKTQDVHVKMGMWIFGSIVSVANPFETSASLADRKGSLEPLMEELAEADDLDDEDVATLHIRTAFDKDLFTAAKALRAARYKSEALLSPVAADIKRMRKLRMDPRTTVGELKNCTGALTEQLAAVEAAPEVYAKPAMKAKLGKLLHKARMNKKAIINKMKEAKGGEVESLKGLKEEYKSTIREYTELRYSKKAKIDEVKAAIQLLNGAYGVSK